MQIHSVLPLGGLFSCQGTDYYLLTFNYHDPGGHILQGGTLGSFIKIKSSPQLCQRKYSSN